MSAVYKRGSEFGRILVEAKRYWKRTKLIAALFAVSLLLLWPFLNDNFLNRYWHPYGAALCLVVGFLFLGLLFVLVMAFIHWQEYRELTAHDVGRSGSEK